MDPRARGAARLGLVPLPFIALPDDIARAAAFLLSDEARWISGAILPIEGAATA